MVRRLADRTDSSKAVHEPDDHFHPGDIHATDYLRHRGQKYLPFSAGNDIHVVAARHNYLGDAAQVLTLFSENLHSHQLVVEVFTFGQWGRRLSSGRQLLTDKRSGGRLVVYPFQFQQEQICASRGAGLDEDWTSFQVQGFAAVKPVGNVAEDPDANVAVDAVGAKHCPNNDLGLSQVVSIFSLVSQTWANA